MRDQRVKVAAPSWRPDIVGEADLVEEVTRVWGFDEIPTTSLPRLSATSRPVRTPLQRRLPQARRVRVRMTSQHAGELLGG